MPYVIDMDGCEFYAPLLIRAVWFIYFVLYNETNINKIVYFGDNSK